jgi:hypothetical protein
MITQTGYWGGSKYKALTADWSLPKGTAKHVTVEPDAGTYTITLPSPTKYELGGPHHILWNDTDYDIALDDADEVLSTTIEDHWSAYCYVGYNAAGNNVWRIHWHYCGGWTPYAPGTPIGYYEPAHTKILGPDMVEDAGTGSISYATDYTVLQGGAALEQNPHATHPDTQAIKITPLAGGGTDVIGSTIPNYGGDATLRYNYDDNELKWYSSTGVVRWSVSLPAGVPAVVIQRRGSSVSDTWVNGVKVYDGSGGLYQAWRWDSQQYGTTRCHKLIQYDVAISDRNLDALYRYMAGRVLT